MPARPTTPAWLRPSVLATGAAIYVALMMMVWGQGPIGPDATIVAAAHDVRTGPATQLIFFITQLGAVWLLTALTAASAIVLARFSRRAALFVVASVAGAALLAQAMKALVSRTRPSALPAVYEAGGYSFPSGHSMVTLAYFMAVTLVVRQLRPKLRYVAVAIALPLIAAVGLSRIYLGVHYPSDVLAGWALGTTWVLLVYGWYRAGADGDSHTAPEA